MTPHTATMRRPCRRSRRPPAPRHTTPACCQSDESRPATIPAQTQRWWGAPTEPAPTLRRFPGRLYPVTVTAQPLHILQRVRTTPRTVHNVIKLQALSRPTLHAPQLQLPLRLTAELLPLIAVIPIIAIRHSIIPPMILIQDHVEPLRISERVCLDQTGNLTPGPKIMNQYSPSIRCHDRESIPQKGDLKRRITPPTPTFKTPLKPRQTPPQAALQPMTASGRT
jgi:hypothetical protein